MRARRGRPRTPRAPGAERSRREPHLGRRVDPARGRATRSSGCSRSTRRRCRRSHVGCGRAVVSLGNLFRDQLDRYGELEIVAERWRGDGRRSSPTDAVLCVNADDPLVGDLAPSIRAHASRSVSTIPPRRGRASSTPPTRSTAFAAARLRATRRHTSAISATIGALPCGHARPALDVAARRIELRGTEGAAFDLVDARGHAAGRAGAAGPLQRLQRTRGGRGDTALGVDVDEIAGRAGTGAAGVRPLRAYRARRSDPAAAADQEPGRRERGAADGRLGRRTEARDRRAQRRDRRRARRLVDLGRRLRAARAPAWTD